MSSNICTEYKNKVLNNVENWSKIKIIYMSFLKQKNSEVKSCYKNIYLTKSS